MTEPAHVQVLSYADGRPGQPLDSVFAVQESPGGVTLTRPLSAEPVRAAVAGLTGVVFAGIALLLLGEVLFDPRQSWGGCALATIPALAMASIAAASLFFAVAIARPRTLVMRVDADGLTVVNGPATVGYRPWRVRRPVRFRAGAGSPDVLRLRTIRPLLVRRRWGVHSQVLSRVPAAECLWLADVLNAAWARASTTGPAEPADGTGV